MIEKLDSAVLSDDYIVFGNLVSDFVKFFVSDIGLSSVSLFNINLNNENFDYYDPETINHFRLMGQYNKFKQHKALKKSNKRNLCL